MMGICFQEKITMYWFIRALAILVNIHGGLGTKCLKNDDIGWREENMYDCVDPERPVCCEQDRQFVCCERNSYKNMREQIQLWITVLVFCLALYIVYLYYRRDSGTGSGWAGVFPCGLFIALRDWMLSKWRKLDHQETRYREDYKKHVTSSTSHNATA